MDYEEQLDRAMDQKPDIAGSESRFEVPEPNVRKEGNVTVYENFQSTLDRLGREQDHVLKFIQNELGTSAQIDESGRARLTGEFDGDRVEAVLDEYVETYVTCPECGLPDTNLVTEDDTERLHCEACGARSAV
ncbi:translation initiation factor IF-2 subunit beta [Halobacterium litoreum]|uniref:Translation initiation factor 2 subunit beta n=1 Tax=Halobacterium litoreum TaxID=2039234 RepID=A0ABD5NC57_9EURY|nr:translation initiation factor IF-2 subunit beta [Halobacterium litoreum]UHH14468.1 translation initiation factor IF-2 subunit beta [Halobacterium litoreum]